MNDIQSTKIYANAYNSIPELGPIKLAKIFKKSQNLAEIWRTATASNYIEMGIDQKCAQIIVEKKREIDPEKSFLDLKKYGIEIILFDDPQYPALLKEIHSAPPILYARGRVSSLSNFNLAVVGTRKLTSYGKQVILSIVPQLAQRHINIVSGLAFGVDATVLQCALDTGLEPIAVLPMSLADPDISPRSNYHLAMKIIEAGCLVSEYPIGSTVQKQNFPIRNRIIAGLSVGTLVIEADETSGALITAKYALDQNRHVFAVPGSIFWQTSKGTNRLIKAGASPVFSADDIIKELNLDLQPREDPVNVKASSPEEILVLEVLKSQASSLDEIIRETKLTPAKITVAVSMLELAGRIKNLGNGTYARII